jgi:polysaccharide deacetylase family protein (PEP-CTERM system associated)
MLNALTIDVEDYFQVQAFANVIPYEDWKNYESRVERNTHRILDLLSNSINPNNPTNSTNLSNSSNPNPIRATFFILGWIAERCPGLVREIRAQGHEIACHGYAHQLIYGQSPETFREDIKKAKAIIEDITGEAVIGYRAPSYSITGDSLWAFEVLMEEGFRYDSSVFPIRHDFYGLPQAPRFPFTVFLNGKGTPVFSPLETMNIEPRNLNASSSPSNAGNPENFTPTNPRNQTNQTNQKDQINQINQTNQTDKTDPTNPINPINPPRSLIEVPLSTVRLGTMNLPLAGGGYFRLFPYAMTAKGLKRINDQEQKPFVFYLHPWELDPQQPRISGATAKSRFRHYLNLNKTESRFRNLLRDFNFAPVREVLGMI